MARLVTSPAAAGQACAPPERPRRPSGLLWAFIALHAGTVAAADLVVGARSPASLTRLSIEELGQIEISSVSKRPERLAEAAAAVYVITREDIRRAGVSSLPEALRLAPNLEVARTSSSTYAISARGFNINSSNKLLVLIDGRSVYNPLNSGVFWEAQDVMLEDIDRIEVVSGPGGTLWGSNAVNGVINILTRSAADTQGSLVSLSAGNDENVVALRHGIRWGDEGALRLYVKAFRRDDTQTPAGASASDGWNGRQAGFRTDWKKGDSAFTVQGDIYDRLLDLPGTSDKKTRSGGNLLGRWDKALANGDSIRLQGYFDRVRQRVPGVTGFSEANDTCDVQVQYGTVIGRRHDLVVGAGYRVWRNATTNGPVIVFMPTDFNLTLADVFAQDAISLGEHLKLTLGVKVERNSYTGTEVQPNVRLAWKPGEHELLWSAVSRAVRTPARVDRDFVVLGFPQLPLVGNTSFRSESLVAYEAGWRAQASPALSYSVSAFYNVYDRLRSIEPAPGGGGQMVFDNKIDGRTYGLEMWASYQPEQRWRLSAGYTLLRQRLHFKPDSAMLTVLGSGAVAQSGNDPPQQFSIRSTLNLPHDTEFDLSVRRVGALPDPVIPAYTALDARVGWHVNPKLELSLTGRNLADGGHAEFSTNPMRELGRSVALSLLWTP